MPIHLDVMARTPVTKAYLIAVPGLAKSEVYAAVKPEPETAMAAVAEVSGRDLSEVSYVGILSRRAAKNLGLKPDEVRRV